jgi:hypothetical protein
MTPRDGRPLGKNAHPSWETFQTTIQSNGVLHDRYLYLPVEAPFGLCGFLF